MRLKQLFSSLAILLTAVTLAGNAPALGIARLSDNTINEAIRYGLENQEVGISTFLGGNWREGAGGTLLNIYTPYMEIARSASQRNLTTTPNAQDIADARKTIIEDIDYIWHHPTVKFMVSFYGDNPHFAKQYFAVIEGVGRGRSVTIYPTKSIPQYLAEQEPNVKERPFTAINAYHFKYEDLAPLDEFSLRLYGKGVEPVTFKIISKDIQ